MKKLIFGIVLLLTGLVFTFSVDEEEISLLDTASKYKVITVQGRILFKKSGDDMQRGDTYVSGTLLEFVSNKSRAALANKDKGRFILTGNTKGKVRVLPAANNISSRKGALLNIVDLKKHFDEKYLVLGTAKIQIGKEAFPMDEKNFFYLTYQHGEEEIAKRLSFEEDKLIFDRDEIFKIDGKPIEVEEKEMTLYYRKDGKGTRINTFTPIFPNLVDLKAEVSVILEMFEDETVEQQFNEVESHLIEFHGKPDSDNLDEWMKKEFDLEKK